MSHHQEASCLQPPLQIDTHRQVLQSLEIVGALVRETARRKPWVRRHQEDLEQDVILQLMEGAPYDPARGAPRAWIYWALRAVLSRMERKASSYHDKRRLLGDEREMEEEQRRAEIQRAPDHGMTRRMDLRLLLQEMPPADQEKVASRLLDEGDRATRKRLGIGRRARDRHLRRLGALYEEPPWIQTTWA